MSEVLARWSRNHEELAEAVPPAKAADVASPEAIVTALHESLNGPRGAWSDDRFRSLCVPNVLFASLTLDDRGATVVNSIPLDDFVAMVREVHENSGWYESITEITSVVTVDKKGGALAVVHYAGLAASTPDGEPVEQGHGQASLMFDGRRWWVVSKTW